MAALPFFLAPADLSFAGSADRFHKNLAALQLVHQLETTGRPATMDERRILAHYSAFGESALLNRLFRYDPTSNRYVLLPAYAAFLSPDDARALRSAALTAFYTPLDLIATIWQAVIQLGLDQLEQPRILEPAAGVGHFISAMPPDLRARAAITAVELDPVSARILRHLHPDLTLHAGLGIEQTDLPPAWFDLVISNVPFGSFRVHDPHVPPALCHQIHDYFLAKALHLVRPGGLVVCLTSWGTLDKQAHAVRTFLAEQATLLGAFRLPNGVFAQISGSASATDLIILQKKPQPAPEQPRWLATTEADYPRSSDTRSMTTGSRYTSPISDPDQLAAARITVNQHWCDQPASLIGEPRIVVHDQSLWFHVAPPAVPVASVLATRMRQMLPAAVMAPTDTQTLGCSATHPNRELLPLADRRAQPIALPQLGGATQARATGLATIYNAAKALIKAELQDDPATDAARANLNQIYDQFIAAYGVIHDPRNQQVFRDLPELQFLLALERNPRRTPSGRWLADREPIFTTRTIRPQRTAAPGSRSPGDALLCCLDERGTLDLDYVATLAGLPRDQTIAALGARIYRLPGTHAYELADVYLSGDVGTKLRDARAWAARDPAFGRNVAALEAVQPTPLGPQDIRVNLGAFWLPDTVVTTFIQTLLPAWTGSAHYRAALSDWLLSDPGNRGATTVEATTRWGTPRAHAMAIIQASLRGVPITVSDLVIRDGRERRVLNPAETVAAQEKQQAIHHAFQTWLWDDPARADDLCARYNARFNTTRIRSFDGSHLSFPGITTTLLRDGDLARHQKDAVWQILQSPSTLLGFAVGGGKTFTAIAAAVEARRLGICRKPLAVVPNHLVSQWANEARRLYPGINVLAMAPEDFTKARRGTVLSRIATGDWDLMVIAHTSFTLLPLSTALVTTFRDQETDRLRAYLEEQRATATTSDEKRSLKQIERALKQFDARLHGLLDRIARDSSRTITWDELGVDLLIVDEVQAFKNLFVPTRLTGIAGLPSAHSQRALDMRMKTWDLLRRQKKVVFLTATPIMNTIGEAYVMQLYLQQAQLEALGIHHFDEWVSLYAQPSMAFELKPDGSGFRMHTRLASFVNLPELATMWRQVLTVRTKAQMHLPEPALVTGKLIPVVVPPSAALTRYVQSLAARAEAVRSGRVDPTVDNMLRVVGDGRKAALDIRLVVPQAPRPRQSKIAALVAHVAQLYHTTTPVRGTQLIFCDLATPKGSRRGEDEPPTRLSAAELEGEPVEGAQEVETAEERWLSHFVYAEIRAGLIAHGLPSEAIAFIHDATTKAQRDALFAAVNDGRIRVLIGSTGKMSTGMNVQQRLIALHNLDCPWRPGDLEQRHGRILRQGNQWPEVYLFAYLSEGSLDGYMWQTIERKAHFIEQVMAGEITARTVEDTADSVLSAAEIKAIASGNPQVVRKVQLEAEVARMERVRAVWLATRHSLQRERLAADEDVARIAARRAQWAQAAAIVADHPHEPFVAQVVGTRDQPARQTFTERAAAGAAVRARITDTQRTASLQRQRQREVIAHYRGLQLIVTAHAVFDPDLHLCLPDGTSLEHVTATTDSGIWQSVAHGVSNIPERIRQQDARRAEVEARIATLEHEHARLATWDGQAAYVAATRELSVITAAFAAAAEADANADLQRARGEDAAAGVAPAPVPVTTPASPLDHGPTLAEELLALARAERAEANETTWQPCIPPAPALRAWMAAACAHQASLPPTKPELQAEAPSDSVATTPPPQPAAPRSAATPDPRHRVHPPRAPAASHSAEQFWQLPLF
ncbi:MAG: helicase-related protein [Oscillochloridaceae bacterium umkhey_bin13]